MNKVIEIFESIKNTSSTNEKSAIIAMNENNELFKTCLRFLLDSNITTGISTKKYSKIDVRTTDWEHKDIAKEFVELLNYITEHNSGKDENIIQVKAWCCELPEEIQNFTEQMITKSYKLGADKKLVNKVIENLIPTFEVMLGTPIEKCNLKPNSWISISRKLNGCRSAFVLNKLMTRQGKQYFGVDHIIKDLRHMGYEDTFIDGELLYKNEEGLSDSEAFQRGTGVAMSKEEDKSCLKLVVFDMFPLTEFWNGKSTKTYKERKKDLLELQERIKKNGVTNIEVVPIVYEGTDHTQIDKWLDYAEDNDWEGCMINLDTPYECKRTKNLIKVKRFFNCDLLCTGVEEGSGRNKGTLGALVCDYKGNELRVGSGFSDEDRKHYWENPEDVVGHIVSIKYKEETKNKDGGVSLQFPVWECLRYDKSEPSYN